MDIYCKQFQSIFLITNLPKLRSFQFRLLHGAIVLNSHLYRWKMRPDNLCSFCDSEKEDINHFLFSCPISNSLWKDLCELCYHEFAQKTELTFENVVFNRLCQKSVINVSNFLCLVTKQFLYRQRCLGLTPIFSDLKCYIYQLKNFEKYIAVKNDNLKIFTNKWQTQDSNAQEDLRTFIDSYFI